MEVMGLFREFNEQNKFMRSLNSMFLDFVKD